MCVVKKDRCSLQKAIHALFIHHPRSPTEGNGTPGVGKTSFRAGEGILPLSLMV